MKLKKFLCMATAISMVVTFSCLVSKDKNNTFIGATAEDSVSYGDFKYTVVNNEVTISGLNTTLSEVIIPESINGMPVTKIGRLAFAGDSFITKVQLPKSLYRIEAKAFQDCTGITSIEIPDSVYYVEESVFKNCTNLSNVKWSINAKFFSNFTFYGTKIQSINIPEGTNYICSDCFAYTPLKEVVLPSSVHTIGIEAFKGCSQLKKINLDNVSVIDNGAFNNCISLQSVTLSPKMTKLSNAFINCKSIKQLIIPEGVKEISSLQGCSSLEYIYVPSTVIRIYSFAFASLTNLKAIDLPDQINYEVFQDYTFYQCSSLEEFYMPFGISTIPWDMFNLCTSLEYVQLTDDVTEIGQYAFSNCESLIAVYIPDSVTKIDKTAFGYAYDETGNQIKTDQNVIFLIESYDCYAAQYASENGFDVININDIYNSDKKGDVDLDGVVDNKDVLLLKNYLLNSTSLKTFELYLADMNNDDQIDIFDLVELKNTIVSVKIN